MISTTKRIIISAAAFLAIGHSMANAQDRISFDQPETELTGRLFGSYVGLASGEILKGRILHLNAPITIAGNKESEASGNRKTVRNVDNILMEFDGAEPTDEMLGGIVLVSGRLQNAPSGPFHTKVRMLVDKVTLIEEATNELPAATFQTQ